ncbi:MAG: thioredoxin family protein [Synergistaceae bacterium]|nr:thioredoxin family protein [Synergistaceae bacterium]MBQ6435845.1 thioredoxin family protein [Synergistaceae bacterium]MBQ6738154.1 thioredoxin family protein [Synergistaceae bacterium]MBR0074170.1 thioredoxin family protein [Synergistaceae bacterium]MBR0078915.1 thioredoxin family protein [Synergistaceae bacterium]
MSSKKVLAFYLEGCPYCKQAREALKELISENEKYSSVSFEWVEENQHPEISEKYDYYSVPSMFVDGEKIYEAHRGEKYEECKENVRKVLEAAS